MSENKKATAIVDLFGGKAVIEESDGRVFVLEHHNPKPVDGSGINLGMFLQPAMTHLESKDAGEYPYAELHKYLVSGYEKELRVSLFLSMIDPDLPEDLRVEARDILEEDFQKDEELRKVVEERLTAVSMPGSADITLPVRGKTAEILAKIIATRK